mmetsp:Transcript_9266/g.13536  ORF Transcript_9266/g.13536 Transcript_9266/m.13536 type:complete len:83 (+) Transcript_9266:2-250(+)
MEMTTMVMTMMTMITQEKEGKEEKAILSGKRGIVEKKDTIAAKCDIGHSQVKTCSHLLTIQNWVKQFSAKTYNPRNRVFHMY